MIKPKYSFFFRLQKPDCSTIGSEQFYSTISQLPGEENIQQMDRSQLTSESVITTTTATGSSEIDSDDECQMPDIFRSEQVKFGEISGTQELRIKMKVRKYFDFVFLVSNENHRHKAKS